MVYSSGDVINMSKKSFEIKLNCCFSPCVEQAQDTQSLMAWVNALRESNPEKDVSTILPV